jgi:hypothetical protein
MTVSILTVPSLRVRRLRSSQRDGIVDGFVNTPQYNLFDTSKYLPAWLCITRSKRLFLGSGDRAAAHYSDIYQNSDQVNLRQTRFYPDNPLGDLFQLTHCS